VIRSVNFDDIHKALKYGNWTSTPKNNEYINKIWESTQISSELNAQNIEVSETNS